MKHPIQPTFLRNEGVGKLYKATINQAELGVVTGMQVRLEADYKYVALGALYHNGVELVRPTRPWRDDVAFDGKYGNIPTRHGSVSKYSFGPATSEETVLYWHKFIEYEQNKTLLICDRNIVCSISWSDLDFAGFIFGKEIELDGQRYKCRVLTGGSANRDGGLNGSYAGGQLPNEWDRYVMNGADIGEPHFADAPIPVPEDYPSKDLSSNQTAWARAHNQAWNWISMSSWCRELSSSSRAIRGGNSARYWCKTTQTSATSDTGWRPVLELLS